MATFGQRIRQARQARRWSLQALAIHVGAVKSHLWEIEQDRHLPNVQLAARIARALNTTVDALLDAAEPVPPTSLCALVYGASDA